MLVELNRSKGFRAYAASKLAIVLFSLEAAERLKNTRVTVNALHPGHVATGIWKPDKPLLAAFMRFMTPFLITPGQGAETSVYLAVSDEVRGVTGRFFDNCAEKKIPERIVNSPVRTKLWETAEELVGL